MRVDELIVTVGCQDIIDSHPGLACLTAAPEFHSRYIETVRSVECVILY